MAAHDQEFQEFVAARSSALLRTAFLLTGDHHLAEDLLQSALIKTYLAWRRIRTPEAAESYVRRVLVTTQISWWRRHWRGEVPTSQLPEPRTGEPPAAAVEDEVWSHVVALPPRQRAALVLRYYEDLSEAETARLLGCSVGTVKSQSHRALAALRQRLDTPTEPSTAQAPGGQR